MPYKDKDAQREYQRLWAAKRRAEWFSDKICIDCGSIENLEIDHTNRKEKVSHKIFSWSKERRDAELAKCVVRCKTCHTLKGQKEGDYGHRKISTEDMLEIRRRYAAGGVTQKELAEEYGCLQPAISKIVLHQTRKFI